MNTQDIRKELNRSINRAEQDLTHLRSISVAPGDSGVQKVNGLEHRLTQSFLRLARTQCDLLDKVEALEEAAKPAAARKNFRKFNSGR